MAMLIAGLGVASNAPASGKAPQRMAPGSSSPPAPSGVEAGWDLLRQGRHREAIRLFTAAKARSQDGPMLFLGLGVARYRLMEFGPAAASLRRALELNPDLEEAHTILGAISFALDELDSSIRHYENAFRLNPNDVGIQDRLFAVRRAAEAERMLQRLSHPHVIVKYDPSHRGVALRVAERWEAIHRRIGRRLEDVPAERTIVILYAPDRFSRHTDTPAWLEEGLALYFEGRDRAWSREILNANGVDLIPLHALHESFLGLPAGHARVAYAESYSAACVLIDRYGLKQVRRLLALLAETPDFSAAFETILKSPYHEFEAGWVLAERQRRL